MSTLPGLASKGEKSKSKFQSLDINNLYRVSRGENLEKQQQKSTLTYKHGMQSLGKVPNARRAPANLPSLKSEYSGSETSVPLVPPGGPGWGKQDSTSTTANTSITTTTTTAATANSSSPSNATPQLTSHQAAIALPVTTTIQPPQVVSAVSVNKQQQQQQQQQQQSPLTVATASAILIGAAPATTTDKSWSSVMTGTDQTHHPPIYQSPQFQHEFPSLSSIGGGGIGGDGGGVGNNGTTIVATRLGNDTQQQYTPGLSLRPQTEGSWIQGGSRAQQQQNQQSGGNNNDIGGVQRNNSAALGGPPQLSAQVGLQQQPLPPQYRAVMPTFMYKGSLPPNGNGVQNQNIISPMNGRNRQDNRLPPRMVDMEEITPRPIIKEEELSRMDEIDRDLGWTAHDDIDYNKKLAFSDDESTEKNKNLIRKDKKDDRQQQQQQQQQQRGQDKIDVNDTQSNNNNRNITTLNRQRSSEDEFWKQRRNQHNKDLQLTVERAKQRKEEEEKRFNEATKQGAAKKLMELEEKLNKRKSGNEDDNTIGTINPNVVPPKPIIPADIPLPDFQRDKDRERESRSRTPNDNQQEQEKINRNNNNTNNTNNDNSFRQLTQIEGNKNFPRNKHVNKSNERDRDRDIREQNGPSFSRHFQNQLPPRFLKQRNNSNNNNNTNTNFNHQFDNNRWTNNGNQLNKNSPNNRLDNIDNDDNTDKKEYTRQNSEETNRNTLSIKTDKYIDDHDYNRRNKDDDKWPVKETKDKKEYATNDDWHIDRRNENKQNDRPQRPDSRDSRTSRDSRHSRDSMTRDLDGARDQHIGSWAESVFEQTYDDKRRDNKDDRHHHHHHRQHHHHHLQVPGPITKERIEADDMKNEKRNLTQLKRGQIPDKKVSDRRDNDELDKKINLDSTSNSKWCESSVQGDDKFDVFDKAQFKSDLKQDTNEAKKSSDNDYKDDKRNRQRIYPQNKNWNNNEYHRSNSGWTKRSQPATNRNLRSARNNDYHCTDSDGSFDEFHEFSKEKSPKSIKKFDKDDLKNNKDLKNEKNKIDKRNSGYVPRGEPSRHGRGGGNSSTSTTSSFRGGRGGISKRIDGYGPPPSKSPFSSHHHDKDKKAIDDSTVGVMAVEDKTKQSQQALSAGIIGNVRKESTHNQYQSKYDDKSKLRNKIDARRPIKTKTKSDDNLDSNSDNSDDKSKKLQSKIETRSNSSTNINQLRRNPPPPPRLSLSSSDKRNYGTTRDGTSISRQNSSNTLHSVAMKKDDCKLIGGDSQNALCNAIADITLKNKDDLEQIDDLDEKISLHGDLDGFQEVKSKKVKERQKSIDEKLLNKPINKIDNKDSKQQLERKPKLPNTNNCNNTQLTQQQISNIPSLMATPIHPPQVLPMTQKTQFERPRQSKLAPRFAKQRENNRLQKAQMHQQPICDDLSKTNQNLNVYSSIKDTPSTTISSISNAWDKTLGTPFKNLETDHLGVVTSDGQCKTIDHAQSSSQNNSPNSDKLIGKSNQLQDKAILDGTTPPVNTIIFENTNFKSAPGSKNTTRTDNKTTSASLPTTATSRLKLDDGNSNIENSVVTGFNKPIGDLLSSNNNKDKQNETSLQLPLSFKEDNADIKLDFFDTDISHLTDDKSTKNLCSMSRTTIHATTRTNNSTISTTDALNFKIQSVKKMWETPNDHHHHHHNVGQDDQNSSFSTSFVTSDPSNPLDPNAFKTNDTSDDNHEGYSPSPNQVASNISTNVCKVKPTQQISGSSGGQTVLSSSSHQQHTGIVAPTLMGNHPLSPSPLQTVIGANVNIGQPPQQYTSNQHLSYQASLGGSNQYGISAIPSPPTVMYNSTQQQLQAAAAQTAGLYGPFQIDQGVLSGQNRVAAAAAAAAQYSQYTNPYANLGQTASSPYSTQSVYLHSTAQPPPPPHAAPPPSAQAPPPPPPDLYQNMSNYRLSNAAAAGPFGQNQQLNNPTTVLISSTSNSLMSASVKPSNQQISAIGTKAGGVGQAYQQQSQQSQQVYMAYEPALQGNYLQSAGVLQRGSGGPVQNNVVPTLQPSSSYYSGSTGGQTGYFQQPGNSTLQSAQLQQHQAGYGLQGNVFGTHSQSHTNAGLQSFNSHYFSSTMLAALTSQQFRSAAGLPAQYMKNVGNQQMNDQSGGRSQQLKSPGSQEVLSSVFNSGSQISSPKLRQNCKQPPPQPSPTTQHKYNLYQGVGSQQSGNMPRYPTPIQRPVNFQQNLGSVQQSNNANNQKHRGNNASNKAPSRQYYQSNSLTSQNDKVDDSKLNDSSLTNVNSTNVTSSVSSKTVIGTNSTATVNSSSEIAKDAINLEESSSLKD